ncbi:MAG: ComEC family competence protein [Elioraea sp.]|nr:ComEC family competence protein [Elioraea sp.]
MSSATTPSLPWLAVAFGAGVGLYFALDREPSGWVAVAALVTAIGVLWVSARSRLLGPSLLGLAAAAGFSAAVLRTAGQPPLFELPTRAVTLEGVVAAVDVLPEGRRIRLTRPILHPDGATLQRDLRIRLHRSDTSSISPGERIRVRALVRPPAPPAAPGAFDFQRHAFFAGLGGVGFALAAAERLGNDGTRGSGVGLAALRQAIILRVLATLGGVEGSVAAALLTGQRQSIPEPVMEDLRRSGLAHLLAVSGLPVGIAAGLAYLLCRFALALWPPLLLHLSAKKVAAAVGVAAGFGYMLLTGSQVPMRRAVAMAALFALAVLLDRRLSALRALAFAALIVLGLQPEALLGASFQMSFAAVLALVVAWEGLRRSWLSPRREISLPARLAVGFAALLVTSAVASAATTPFVAHHFQRVPLYGVAANAIAVPLTSFWIMPWGLLALILMPVGLEPLAFAPMGWGISAVIAVAQAVSSWPAAAPSLPASPSWTPAAAGLGLILVCLARPFLKVVGVVLLAAGPVAAVILPQPDLLIAPDGRALALRVEGAWHLHARADADRFVLAQWRQRAGDVAFTPLDPRSPPSPALRCDRDACLIGPEDLPRAILLLREGPVAPWCGRAPLIVSLEPVRGRCPPSIVLDRFAPWRNGAYAIRLDGPEVLSDAAWRGERPWVRLPGRRQPDR